MTLNALLLFLLIFKTFYIDERHCAGCHSGASPDGIDLSRTLDAGRVPASYRTLVSQGWVHYFDWSYNPGGNEKAEPLTFGNRRSRLWPLLDAGRIRIALVAGDTVHLLFGENWAGAIAILEPLRKKTPDDVDVLFQLGAAYERAGKIPQAEEAFQAVLTKQPDQAGTLNYLGYMNADRGARVDEGGKR